MKPVDFPQKNIVLVGPPETSRELIIPLPAFKGFFNDGTPAFISCWEPNDEERKAIAEGKPVWFVSLSRFHPPISLITENPFDPPKKEETSEDDGTVDAASGRTPEGGGSGD